MKKCIYLTVLCYLAFYSHLFSQMETPSVIPPSPEVAALGKYGDIPVSYYTGTASFSIPLYTIQSKDVTLPISIDYHSGGIKVSEEASWVGLGWSLRAGGMISRAIRGKDDLGVDGYCDPNNPAPELLLSQFSDPRLLLSVDDMRIRDCNILDQNQVNHSFCSTGISINADGGFESNPNQIADLMPDAFSYALPVGGGGSFFLNKQKTPILTKAGLTQILFTNGSTPTWEIRAENGMRYLFELSANVEIDESGVPQVIGPSSWPLTRMISPGGSEIIFEYHPAATIIQHPPASTSKEETNGGYTCQGLTPDTEQFDTQAKLRYKEYYLKKISFDKGYVEFVSVADRQDLAGSRRLTEVKAYHYAKGNSSFPQLVRSFSLENDVYFHGMNSSNVLAMQDPNGYLAKRMKLEGLQDYGSDLTQTPTSHSFDYFEGSGALSPFDPPHKHSFAQDYWGYYNGMNSNDMLIPEYNGFNPLTGSVQNLDGANRSPDVTSNHMYAKAGMLKTITYPTGGTTEIDYELHDFSGSNSVTSQTFAETESFTAYSNGSGTSGIIPFSIPSNAMSIGWEGNIFYDYFSASQGGTGLLINPDELKVEIRAVGSNSPIIEWDYYDCVYNGFLSLGTNYTGLQPYSDCQDFSETIQLSTLPAGDYELAVTNTHNSSANSSIPASISVTLTWHEISSISLTGSQYEQGGGLRVKQITSSAEDDSPPMTRYFNYHYFKDLDDDGTDEELSYGQIMSVPIFHLFTDAYDGNAIQSPSCTRFVRFSGSVVPHSGSASGYHVGYNKVEVLTNQNGQHGKTIYHYYHQPDLQQDYSLNGSLSNTHRGVPSISFPTNGLLKAEYTYKSDGSGGFEPVKESHHLYQSEIRDGIYGLHMFGSYPSVTPTGASNGSFNYAQEDIFLYLSPLFSDWVYLKESKEILYDQDDPQKKIEIVSRHAYHPEHLKLIKTNQFNSLDYIQQTRFKYAMDYDSSLLLGSGVSIGNLLERNLIAHPIETQSWSGPDATTLNLTAGSLNTYQDAASTTTVIDKLIVPHRSYVLETNQPLDSVSFSQSINADNKFTTLIPDPTYYKERMSISYNSQGNVSQTQQTFGQASSFIWGYLESLPVAQITNASSDEVAYSSFEESHVNSDGNWTISVPNNAWVGNGKTGLHALKMTNSSAKIEKAISQSGTYILSFWYKGRPRVIASGSTHNLPSKNEWTYWEKQFSLNAGQTIKIKRNSGYPQIDEVRLYPADAFMTTICYDDQLRIHTQTDANNQSKTYHYDHFGRMEYVQDQDGNYVQHIEYHIKD